MIKELNGKRFGRLLVIGQARSRHKSSYWSCVCDCGKETEVKSYTLTSGQSTSCGCYQREVAGELKRLPSGVGAFRQLFSTYKGTAKRRGLSFDLTKEQFQTLTLGNCFYCGVEPKQILKRRFGTSYTYNGVDRLNSDIGYTVENCVSCCGTHNLMKLDMSVEEFLAACKSVADYRSLNVKSQNER